MARMMRVDDNQEGQDMSQMPVADQVCSSLQERLLFLAM